MSVGCAATAAESSAFLQRLTRAAAQRRVPLSGAIELTSRCNLDCVHCYLGPHGTERPAGRELDTESWLGVLDEVAAAGCLFMLVTGGEPLLRPDFGRIYRHARELGLLVSVFTNGTLLRREHAELFAELPPSVVEVSLYGASAATHDAVTGVRGSFTRALEGVKGLLEAGVRVGLKTVVLTVNRHELEGLRALAGSLAVPFRFDVVVSARADGDPAPLRYRLPPEEALAVELGDEERSGQWRKHADRLRGLPRPEGLYGCGAGVSTFYVDEGGTMFPCLMARSLGYDVVESGFAEGWREVMPALDRREPGNMAGCNTCGSRPFCDVCPGALLWETGVEDGWSAYLCEMGKGRDAAVSCAGPDPGDDDEGHA